MDPIRAMVADTDWGGLDHAYGDAAATPQYLLALLGGDVDARSRAVGYLDAAILHQGAVCSATGPVALSFLSF